MSNNLRLFSIYFKIPVAQHYARKASIYSERYLNFPLAFEFLKVFPKLWMENLRKSSSLSSAILRRQRGRVVRASDLKSVGRGFKSRSDH